MLVQLFTMVIYIEFVINVDLIGVEFTHSVWGSFAPHGIESEVSQLWNFSSVKYVNAFLFINNSSVIPATRRVC
jgi:hypothetical protein